MMLIIIRFFFFNQKIFPQEIDGMDNNLGEDRRKAKVIDCAFYLILFFFIIFSYLVLSM